MNTWAILNNRSSLLIDPFKLYTNNVFEIYKQKESFNIIKLIFRVFRKLRIINILPGFISYNNRWVKNIKKRSNWIIFFDANSKTLCEYIKNKNPNAKVYLYSWDIQWIPENDNCFDGVGIFDHVAAKKNGISCYNQFYAFNKTVINQIKPYQTKDFFQFVFCGKEKNRKQNIYAIKDLCDKIYGNSMWKIVSDNDKGISYMEYLSYVVNSKCIVDVVIDGQSGCSLRAMEALFFNKKLLTNNKYIKEFDFYNPSNIFIFGVDTDIDAFINTPHVIIDDSIKNRYLIESFVDRIINSKI